jgi:hypothetical protein
VAPCLTLSRHWCSHSSRAARADRLGELENLGPAELPQDQRHCQWRRRSESLGMPARARPFKVFKFNFEVGPSHTVAVAMCHVTVSDARASPGEGCAHSGSARVLNGA